MANLNDVVTNQLPTLIGNVKTAVDAVESAVDGLEATEAAIQIACEAIQAVVAAMPLGTFARPTGEITRPDNATQLHAGDCIAASTANSTTHAIDGCARVNGGSGQLFGAVLKTDNRAWTQAVTVAIFDGAGPEAYEADHAAFQGIVYTTEKATCVAVLNFPALAKDADVAGACARASAACDFPRSFTCAAGSKKLYWKMWQAGTPTPAAQQKFTLIPDILQA